MTGDERARGAYRPPAWSPKARTANLFPAPVDRLLRMTDPKQPPFVLPAGTQVVSRVEIQDSDGARLHPHGAVGIVVKAPADGTHSYRVRLPDGSRPR